MIPWVQLGKAPVPGGGEVRLMRRGAEFSIRLGVKELMNSRLSGSEEALATLVCARIRDRARPRVLIGGLGMGFTLRAALGALGADARIEVAELIPAVAQWAGERNEGDFRRLASRPPRAPRTDRRRQAHRRGRRGLRRDPARRRQRAGRFHPLGQRPALRRTRPRRRPRCAGPGGVLAVWSSGPDRKFTQRLRDAGFATEEVATRARGARGGARHVIWIATRPAGASRFSTRWTTARISLDWSYRRRAGNRREGGHAERNPSTAGSVAALGPASSPGAGDGP